MAHFPWRPWLRPWLSPLSRALSGTMLQQSAQNPTAEAVSREPGDKASPLKREILETRAPLGLR